MDNTEAIRQALKPDAEEKINRELRLVVSFSVDPNAGYNSVPRTETEWRSKAWREKDKLRERLLHILIGADIPTDDLKIEIEWLNEDTE